jgi:hypothetical protein
MFGFIKIEKCIYSTYSPWAPHTFDLVVITSLTHPRTILLVVLQIGKYKIGKAKDLSAPLRIFGNVLYARWMPLRMNTSVRQMMLLAVADKLLGFNSEKAGSHMGHTKNLTGRMRHTAVVCMALFKSICCKLTVCTLIYQFRYISHYVWLASA